MLYLKQQRYVEAQNIYEDSLEIMLSNLGPDHLNVAKVLTNMSKFYRKMGEIDKANDAKEKAELIRSKIRY
jgi:tetratricopeptide (TPR) repeat protein